MIDSATLAKATKLKKEMDAAYIVFRTEPTVERAATWTAATTIFNDFCVSTIKELINDETDRREEILANVDKYKTCKQCGIELLHLVDKDNFVTNINFVEGFPGWCYNCLVDHCLATDCSECTLKAGAEYCSFHPVKELRSKSN